MLALSPAATHTALSILQALIKAHGLTDVYLARSASALVGTQAALLCALQNTARRFHSIGGGIAAAAAGDAGSWQLSVGNQAAAAAAGLQEQLKQLDAAAPWAVSVEGSKRAVPADGGVLQPRVVTAEERKKQKMLKAISSKMKRQVSCAGLPLAANTLKLWLWGPVL